MISLRDDEAATARREWSAIALFQFVRDSFAFANELVWEYSPDLQTGEIKFLRRSPPPAYAHHCFVLVRSARQFLYHARFDPAEEVADANTYRRLIREVVSRNPRTPSASEDKIVIPGYDGLRSFSQAQERLLKSHCGGAWQSYFLRSHWRMILPVSRRHQAKTAARLVSELDRGRAPIVHLVRFPQLSINHGMILFEAAQEAQAIRFTAYDPNIPEQPASLTYDRSQRTFFLPPNRYWAGGRVDVFEIYCGWLF